MLKIIEILIKQNYNKLYYQSIKFKDLIIIIKYVSKLFSSFISSRFCLVLEDKIKAIAKPKLVISF